MADDQPSQGQPSGYQTPPPISRKRGSDMADDQPSQGQPSGHQAPPHKKRGKTSGKKILEDRSKGIRPEITVNQFGLAVGETSTLYSTYCGNMARLCPVDAIDWHHVPKDIKDQCWADVMVMNLKP